MEVGQHYNLTVIKTVPFGFYLDAKNLGEVLLPGKYAPADLKINDTIEVFLYLDSEDRPVATTEKPKARVGEFAYLKVAATTKVGAFLDWGLEKDVLVPFAEQHLPMKNGHAYLVYLYLDKIDGRITASSKIDKFIDEDKPHDYQPKQSVELIIANSTDLGFKAIINHSDWGVLYKNEVHQRLSFGQSIRGYIKHIRPDGKIDLSLQDGQVSRNENLEVIETYLRKNNGFAPLHDKSEPKLISELFGMSKGAFKNAIGSLYKQRIISIEKEGIRLNEKKLLKEKKIILTLSKNNIETTNVEINTSEEAKEKFDGNIREVEVTREPIELYKILKFEGMACSGGGAKVAIADGLVKVNKKIETQKRKKIVNGDTIEFAGEIIRILYSGEVSKKESSETVTQVPGKVDEKNAPHKEVSNKNASNKESANKKENRVPIQPPTRTRKNNRTMTNNDCLRRIRYIFDFNDTKMMTLFALADHKVTREQISAWLKKDDVPGFQSCSDTILTLFLNGLINDKRGKKEGPQPKPEKHLSNNIIFMKLKIALNLKAEDILSLLSLTDFQISKHELSAFFRRTDHKHYRECKDQVLRNFLKGIQIKYRGEIEKQVNDDLNYAEETPHENPYKGKKTTKNKNFRMQKGGGDK